MEVTGEVLYSQWQGLDLGGERLCVTGGTGGDRTRSPFYVILLLLLLFFVLVAIHIAIHVYACESGRINIAFLGIRCPRSIVPIEITVIVIVAVVIEDHIGLAKVDGRI